MFFMNSIKKELRGLEINYNDWAVILAIGDYEGISIKDICSGLCIDKAQGTRIVKKLIEKDYIRNTSSGKTHSLFLNEKGRITYAYCDSLFNKTMDTITEGMNEDTINTIISQANEINKKLEKYYEY